MNWLEAVNLFQESYYQLNHYVLSCEPESEPLSRLIGQGSSGQVVQLLAKMYHELEVLVTEVDHSSNLSSLVNHTARLRLLTNQATVLINLLNQSSC